MLDLNCTNPLLYAQQEKLISYSVKISISVVIAVLLVIGSIGNIITITAILKNKCLHLPSNFFIVSLSFSDLISGLICSPLWLYRRTWGFEKWEWGEITCQLYWVLDFMTNYVTSMHILSFALLRCFAVYFPFKVGIITTKRVIIFLGSLWVFAFLVSTPLFAFMGVVNGRKCQNKGTHWPSCSIFYNGNSSSLNVSTGDCCVRQYNTYMLVVSSVFFYFPEILIVTLSIFIARALKIRQKWRNKSASTAGDQSTVRTQPTESVPDVVLEAQASEIKDKPRQCSETGANSTTARGQSKAKSRRNQTERDIFTQLSLIVVAFMIGYLPATIYLVWTTASTGKKDNGFDYWFGVVSYLSLRVSECMNPIMYNLGSSNIRRGTKKLLGLK